MFWQGWDRGGHPGHDYGGDYPDDDEEEEEDGDDESQDNDKKDNDCARLAG